MELVEGIFYSETLNKISEKKNRKFKKITKIACHFVVNVHNLQCIFGYVLFSVEDNFGSSFYASKQNLCFPSLFKNTESI